MWFLQMWLFLSRIIHNVSCLRLCDSMSLEERFQNRGIRRSVIQLFQIVVHAGRRRRHFPTFFEFRCPSSFTF